MSLLGVDIGTSRCKAVAFDTAGHQLAEAVREYTPTYPAPARVEMDPEEFWRAAASVIADAASQVGDDRVSALCISSHGETFLPLGRGGDPIGPAILNVDTRAAGQARELERALGRGEVFRITGAVIHPAYPVLKLRWLREREPALFAAASRFVSVTDYVLLRLGLPPYVDHSLASRFLAFDVTARRWSEEILAWAGVSPERLPTPVPAGATAGRLSRIAAADLNLEPGTLVVVGGHDQPCGAVGMGAVRPGLVSDSMGTYECVVHVDAQPRLDDRALAANLNSYCHVVPDQYITIVYFPSGIMVKWFCDAFCAEPAAGPDRYAELESGAPEGPTGLCITPHLIGSATPHFDSRATGAIVGLVPTTGRHHVYKGILEGLACELAIVSDLLAEVVGPFTTIRATGGGTRSRLGLRLRTALTSRRFQVLECSEAVCLGAALLAGVSAGVYRDLAEAVAQAVRVVETVEPERALGEAYARQLRQYRLLYPALAPLREDRP